MKSWLATHGCGQALARVRPRAPHHVPTEGAIFRGTLPGPGKSLQSAVPHSSRPAAGKKGMAPAHLALAWLMRRGVTPIFGASRLETALDSLKALARLQELPIVSPICCKIQAPSKEVSAAVLSARD